MSRSFISSSNEERLSWKDWIVVAVVFVGMLYFFPMFWPALERFEPPPDYRLPYELSDDYWMFTRWSKYACSNFPILIIGDSVIWGQYVKREHTLSHCLNELAGESMVANMGVDGLHLVAMAGLIKYYGKEISNKGIILQLNPLWMHSEKYDLRSEEEFRFHHPRLAPQLFPNLACYRASFVERVGVVAERSIPFFSWINHVRVVYFENMNMQNWTSQNPYKNPLSAITLEIPIPENKPMSKPVSWVERGIKKQSYSYAWVNIEESFQWSSFKKVIEILNSRKNKVFVLLGPFNPYILTEESLKRYKSRKNKMERWFRENRISYYSVPDLPSEYYADGSHPLKEGYAKIAEELFEMESFRKWIGNLKGRS